MPQIKNLDAGIGWKRLARTLQNLEKVINANLPVKGDGIKIDETATGSIISTVPKTDDAQNTTSQNQTDSGTTPSKLYIKNTRWMEVALVDPTTCSQSTVRFLAHDASGGLTAYDVTVNDDQTWTLLSN